jgi:hypothetical protein
MTRRFWLFVAATLAVSTAAEQARDPRPLPPTGTSALRGRILTTDEPPSPVRRARVVVNSTDLAVTRSVVSDDAGEFVVPGLPAGRYTISASKPAMLRASFGAVRPAGPGTAVALAAGQTVSDLTLRMSRGGVISGIVTDEDGRPVRGVPIRLQQARTMAGVRELVSVNVTPGATDEVSDDRGEFRLFGLGSGEYYVSATPHDPGMGLTRAPDSRTVAMVPIYFPGTPMVTEARPVAVAAGEETAGIDLRLRRVPTARIRGTIGERPGVDPADIRLTLSPVADMDPTSGVTTALTGAIRALGGVTSDWTFSYEGVTPGRYKLTARVVERPKTITPSTSYVSVISGHTVFWAVADLQADGVDISGLTLALQAPMTVSGRVILRSTSAKPVPEVSRVRVSLTNMARTEPLALSVPSVSVNPTGQFTITGVTPGSYRVNASVNGPESGRWMVSSSIAGGRDTLDFPVEIGPNIDLADVVVTLTDATQRISGQLQDAAGRPASAFTIVLFPADRALWASPRRIRATRPGHDGRYSIGNIAAGDYRIAAVFDITSDQAYDPAFLETLLAATVPVTVKPGESKVEDLRIAR